MYGYIYITIDHFNNKVYVGQSARLANWYLKNYFGSNKLIYSLKRDHLQKIILGYCNSKTELDLAEKECIEFFNSQNPIYGYNIASGGQGHIGCKHSLISRQKMSEAQYNMDPETRRLKNLKNSIAHKGKITWNKGKQCPQISVALMGNKNGHFRKGIKFTEEQKQKMRDAWVLRKQKCQ